MVRGSTWRFDTALTPEGWRRDVAVSVGPHGAITAVETGSTAGERITGAAIAGTVNLHSHAFQRAMAGLTEHAGAGEDSFWSWRELMYRFVQRMTPDDVEAVAAFAYMEMLEGGFTGVAEFHYLHHQPDGTPYDNVAEMAQRHGAAAVETGIGLTMLPVFYAQGGFGGAPATAGQRRFLNDIDGFAKLIEAASQAGLRVGIAPHSLRAVTLEQLTRVNQLLPGAPRHIHVSEQVKEVADCRASHGVTPIALLADTVNLSADWCLIHATHATEAELTQIARSGAVVGLCPVTEANLGDGVFPVESFLAQGGKIGVGSDSNVLIGLAEELRILEYGQRLTARRRNVLAVRGGSTGRRLLDAVRSGGAAATGAVDRGLAVGAPADIVVFDDRRPEFALAKDDAVLDAWVFAAGRTPITDVFAMGRRVVRDGAHVRRAEIEQRYRAALLRIA
jgi:formimidoylglutamate deiminase